METQHPNNVVDLMLFQLYCHLASNPNGNAASRRLSTRPDDLTQVLVVGPKMTEKRRFHHQVLVAIVRETALLCVCLFQSAIKGKGQTTRSRSCG